MSPRRSSRARTTQPALSGPSHASSSTSVSSASSGRGERNTRSANKQSSPHKSSTPLSSDGSEANSHHHGEPPLTRRRTREHDNEEDSTANAEVDVAADDTEDEVTRCVCGQLEIPGPPVAQFLRDRDTVTPAAPADTQDDQSGEEVFIQCDICKVWQHGICVGIPNPDNAPDDYFCEECRSDLHRVMTAPNGQKYSEFIPAASKQAAKSRKMSVSKEADVKTTKEKDRVSRTTTDTSTKRRSTMNSRAVYDEEMAMQKAIEESKGEGTGQPVEAVSRKTKRSRDESEDIKHDSKRPRTGSGSATPSTPTPESDPEPHSTKSNNNGKQKPRGAAARSQREREQREREKERERERAEASGRRKVRAERRRAEDSEPQEDNANDADQEPSTEVTASQTPAEPASTAATPASNGTGHRKAGRGHKRGRVVRNQHTKDRDAGPPPASPRNCGASKDNSSQSPQGRSGSGNDGNDNGDGPPVNKPKSKKSKSDTVSLAEAQKKIQLMMTYIATMQVELANEKTRIIAAISALQINSFGAGTGTESPIGDDGIEKDFSTMNPREMMDFLTRKMNSWQQVYGKPGEKLTA